MCFENNETIGEWINQKTDYVAKRFAFNGILRYINKYVSVYAQSFKGNFQYLLRTTEEGKEGGREGQRLPDR